MTPIGRHRLGNQLLHFFVPFEQTRNDLDNRLIACIA